MLRHRARTDRGQGYVTQINAAWEKSGHQGGIHDATCRREPLKFEPISSQPRIEAQGLTLRPLRTTDASLIATHAGERAVARATAWIPHPLPQGMVDALIARSNDPDQPEVIWAMDGTASGGSPVMGLASLVRLDRDQAEISYWVGRKFWNAGIATRAIAALVAANPTQARTIFASVFQDNPASARVLTNSGFAYLGDAESFCVARDTKVPTWTYSKKLD